MTSSGPASGRTRKAGGKAASLGRAEDELLTTAQVAQLLHVHPVTVIRLVREGVIPGHRLPGTRPFLFWRSDVLAVIEASLVKPADVGDGDVEDAEATLSGE